MPATQSRAAAWKMSVPTILAAVSGKTSSITSPKNVPLPNFFFIHTQNVPLPTEVSPTMKPPLAPSATQMVRSRLASRKGALDGWTPRLTNVLARKPRPPSTSAPPITFAEADSTPLPYCCSSQSPTSTPTSDSGADPRNIQNVIRA